MKLLAGAALVVALLGPGTASAVPISAYGGTLDATLRFFDGETSADGTDTILLLRAEYELGVDFMPGVPLSFQQNLTPYNRCLSTVATRFGPCFGQIDPLQTSGRKVSNDPSMLGPLTEACAPLAPGGFLGVMIARGTCAFSTKWENAEDAGHPAVLVENNAPGLLSSFGLIPSANEPTIPFFLITQDVADEIRTGSLALDADGSLLGIYFPIVQMSVTWTPPPVVLPPIDPVPVPEPTSLSLLLTGTACLLLRRTKGLRVASIES